jgi:SAM-dependent methyltransferase
VLTTATFTLEEIRDFWTKQANDHGTAPAASWSDQHVIEMEIRQIMEYLRDGDHVLDVGCANGYSTVQYAARKAIDICGLDYVPEMIAKARERVAGLESTLRGKVDFVVGDISALTTNSDAYDKVIVVRVVINLGNPERQLQALRECARTLKKGGLLLLSEATIQGWRKLNDLRREWGLPDIPMPPFNLYVDCAKLVDALKPQLQLVDLVDFASTYYVGTRLLKPLLAQALNLDMNVADPGMEWNRLCSLLPAGGDYGTQKLFVFRKV